MKVLAVAVCLSFLAAPLRAWQSQPSLAEIAEKEKQRRAAAAKSGKKVYTEDDLKRAGGKSASFPEGNGTEASGDAAKPADGAKPAEGTGAAQPAAGAADAKPPKTDTEIRAERRTDLQKQMDQQVKRRAELQKRIEEAQRALGDPSHNSYGAGHANATKS